MMTVRSRLPRVPAWVEQRWQNPLGVSPADGGDRNNATKAPNRVLTRALLALPLLGLAVAASSLLRTAPAMSFAQVQMRRGEVVCDEGQQRVPILESFYNVELLDKMSVSL